jgi:hypothetical protein
LLHTTIDTKAAVAYDRLKAILTENKCAIIVENAPLTLTTIQGSIWGTNPKTAKKRITYSLAQNGEKTQITAETRLTSDYVKFTLAGCVFSLTLLFVCGWIVADLQGMQGFWSWLAEAGGQFDAQLASLFIILGAFLALFLVVSLVAETFVVLNVSRGIGLVADETLKTLQVRSTQATSN